MAKQSQTQHIYLMIALLGCITGIASLSWQIYDKYAEPAESIVADIYRFSDATMPDKSKVHEWRFLLSVTNRGENDIYVSAIAEGRNGDHWTAYPFKNEEKGDQVFKPGESRIYELGRYSDKELIKLGESLKTSVIARVMTTRGNEVILPKFGLLFAEALSEAKKNVSKQ